MFTKYYRTIFKINLKTIGLSSLLLAALLLGILTHQALAEGVGVSVGVSEPINAAAVHNTATQVNLTWDAAAGPSANIASYDVYYKLKTDVAYPGLPQIQRVDSLASYSELITVTEDAGYDFIVRARAPSGFSSPASCASCETTNATCGNATREPGEECDAAELGGNECTDFGYISGNLGCSVTCEFAFGTCNSGGGGGGGDDFDSIPPTAGTASSPAYTNTSPIAVSYSGATDSGGSGFSHVSLYYKKGTGSFKNSGLTSGATSGSFAFVPLASTTNAIYNFGTQAHDNDGNTSSVPTGNGSTTTIYDSQKPAIGTIAFQDLARSSLQIDYKNAVDVGIAGLEKVELWYKKGSAGTWVYSGLSKTDLGGSFTFTGFTDSNTYFFDLIAVDKAGNRSIENSETKTGIVYDFSPPIVSVVSIEAPGDDNIIPVTYQGAVDDGAAGLRSVELWYKKGETGTWMSTGMISTTKDGIFYYNPTSSDGTYYFDLLLTDNVGNQSKLIAGNGLASVSFAELALEVVLSGLPNPTVDETDFAITAGGQDIVAYKFQLNQSGYGPEIPIESVIQLSGLLEGAYNIDVIGKNSAGQWQNVSSPTSHSWVIDFSQPSLEITGPSPSEAIVTATVNKEVVYQLNYSGHNVVSLDSNDITLNKTNTATGTVLVTSQDFNTWLVTISDIQGEGTFSISVAANTAAHSNGNLAPAAGPSSVTEVNVEPTEEEEDTEEGSEEAEEMPKEEPEATGSTEEALETEVPIEASNEPQESGPNISPSKPKIEYTPVEIEKIAVENLESEKVTTRTPARLEVGAGITELISRIGECKRGFPSVNFNSGSFDTDRDGLSNRSECYLFTNPILPDTDNDGCQDGDELNLYSTDPLNALDCQPFSEEKSVVISSPQPGWLVSKLEVAGLTHNETSRVNLVAFPVLEGKALSKNAVSLGSISEFSEVSIENNFFFESAPNSALQDEQSYDLIAIGTLQDGATIASKPIRFSLDSKAITKVPKPKSIGKVPLEDNLMLKNIEVKPSADGRVSIKGESEYGAQVFAVWQSVVLVSSVLADSELGTFSIESPEALNSEENHRVILYAVKAVDGERTRSQNVTLKFHITQGKRLVWWLFTTLMLTMIGISTYYYYNAKKKKGKKKGAKKRI